MQAEIADEIPFGVAEIAAAYDRIRQVALESPLLESARLSRRCGRRVFVKADSLQPTGSFKIRGAWNFICQLSQADRAKGLFAISSGNHGQAVAWAAHQLGIAPVIVLMPQDTPARKVAKTRDWGAEIVHFDRNTADRQAMTDTWKRKGLTAVPAFDDARVMAGAASVAVEVSRQMQARGQAIGDFYVGCSGGGLAAGCSVALAAHAPGARVWAIEPTESDDTQRSIALGQRVKNEKPATSICDALLAPMPGELTFAINRRMLAGVLTIDDSGALEAMRVLYDEFGLVAEPGGALALGAVLKPAAAPSADNAVVIVSGGNVDPALYAAAISGRHDDR